MKLNKIKSLLEIDNLDIGKYANSFVPYLYLDGHRTSCVSKNEIERYKSGFKFFQRFADCMQSLGFIQMVTMVHTNRNLSVTGRIEAIQTSIQESMKNSIHHFSNSNFYIYGDTQEYSQLGYNDFLNFLERTINRSADNRGFSHHILLNYSEKWALDNPIKINRLPEISSVIRFTKGFVSGGWIPLKMQKANFIYSQIPSSSEFWSDQGLSALLLISLKNWIAIKDYIGSKSYDKKEIEIIHQKRDTELYNRTIKLNLDTPQHNRIVSFDIKGPVIYEF